MPFKGLKIIELASVLAGPMVGTFFAELGAEVLKVENSRTKGDVTRQWKLGNEPKERTYSAYYCAANWGKASIMADLSKTEDRAEIYDLARDADVVIANFKAGAAEKLGMDYAAFKKVNPSIIYGQITGFGDGNPRPAFDVVLQAEAGFMYMNGTPDGPPVKMPVALIDLLAAHQLKEGLLVALYQRLKTGEGAFVSVSLIEAAIASLANQATNWLMAKHIPQRMGSLHPNIAPYGDMFGTKDEKQLVLAVGNDKQFAQLCKVLGTSELAENAFFATSIERVKHRALLAEKLAEFVVGFERDDLIEKLTKAQVPVGAIRNMEEVFELAVAKEMILRETGEDGVVTERVRTVVFRFS